MTATILLAVFVMFLLAGGFAVLLGWANVRWHVEVSPQLQQLIDAMPGVNCGGCGFVGCSEYAEAVFRDGAPPDKCTVGGTAVASRVAEIMGVELAEGFPSRPVVHCGSDYDNRLKRMTYLGERTCAAANIVGGVQGCTYGCLGLGDCRRACDFGAIDIVNGLAVVNYDNCVGCRACQRACPRGIISMIPFKAERMTVVACSNKDPGKVVRQVCKVGCIACGICRKTNDLFDVTGNIARIDYQRYEVETDLGEAVEKCPRKIIRVEKCPVIRNVGSQGHSQPGCCNKV